MHIIDSQVHIWSEHRSDRPWPSPGLDGRNALPNRSVPLGYEEVLDEMNQAGVYSALLIPPSWEGDYNDLVLEAAQKHPDRFGIMGRIAPDDPDGPKKIECWKKQAGMLGVRILFEPGSAWLDATEKHWLWPVAQSARVPITIAARGRFDLIARIATEFPELRISIDHLGADWAKTDNEAFSLFPEILKLAAYKNVAVKASMMPALSSESYPYRNLERYIHAAYDAFGPHRLFWGSNLSRLKSSYSQSIKMFTEELSWLNNEDIEWVMGKAVCQWLGWELYGNLQRDGSDNFGNTR